MNLNMKSFENIMVKGENAGYMKPFENIMVKGENAGYQHFLLLPQCFLTHH